jgi:hypothetical protein
MVNLTSDSRSHCFHEPMLRNLNSADDFRSFAETNKKVHVKCSLYLIKHYAMRMYGGSRANSMRSYYCL